MTSAVFDAVVYTATSHPFEAHPVGLLRVPVREVGIRSEKVRTSDENLLARRRGIALQYSLQINDLEARAVRMRDLAGACQHRGELPGVTHFLKKAEMLKDEAQGIRDTLLDLWKLIDAEEKRLGVAS